MERLRRGLRQLGHKDAEWLNIGAINIDHLTIAIRASARAAQAIRPENAPDAATIIQRIMRRLTERPDLSNEAAEAVAETIAEDLWIELTRK